MEPAKRESVKTEAVEEKNAMLTVRVLWGCQAWNATPEQAAKQVVADLYAHLSGGGSVQVHLVDAGGDEHRLEATAKRQ